MSARTHVLCDDCWWDQEGDREPVRVVDDDRKPCCICGQLTRSGIYKRASPAGMPCGGRGFAHVD